MKRPRILRCRKGAVLPLVTIFLALVGFGIVALVIDASILYVDRKAMITAADAGALAGANILRQSRGVSTAWARYFAWKYAIDNGADADQVTVYVGPKSVTLPSGAVEQRQIVEVTVGVSQQLTFASLLGAADADVRARSVATWGYVYKSYIGEFIPLFIFDTDYQLNTNMMLHDKLDQTNSYGFIDVGSGMNDIKACLAGEKVGGDYIYDNLLKGKPGQGDSLRLGVEARMIKAQAKPTAEERRETMMGLIPIIDRAGFLQYPDNLNKSANQFVLPVKYFAYFEIKDVIKKSGTVGSSEALNPANHYHKVSSPFNYAAQLSNKSADYTFVYGQFTGEIVAARTVAEVGDQANPNATGAEPATYSKLVS